MTACNQKKNSSTTSTPETITVTDNAGYKVKVPKKIKRIAVLAQAPLPSVLAVFFNSAKKIVYMQKMSHVAAKHSLLSELYPEILKAKTFDSNSSTTVNTEELQKLKPDVVFYNADIPAQKKQLENAGFTAVAVSASKWHGDSIETLNQWIALLSKMFPKNDRTKVVKDYSNDMAQRIQKRVANPPADQQQKVLILFNYTNTTITSGGDGSFAQFWLNTIHAKNVASSLGAQNGTPVNMEQIYKWNPQKILISNFTPAQPADLYQNKIGNSDWSKVQAVTDHQVYKMPLGMYRSYTPGVDTPLTLLWFAKTVYPDQFKEIHMIQETKDYYKKVFDLTLTTKQAQRIFEPTAAAGNF